MDVYLKAKKYGRNKWLTTVTKTYFVNKDTIKDLIVIENLKVIKQTKDEIVAESKKKEDE